MLKFIVVLYRRSGLTPEAFQSFLQTTHARLAEALPNLKRYVQNRVVDDRSREHPGWDAIVELSWANREEMEAAWLSPEGKASTADLRNFADLDRTTWSIVEEDVRRSIEDTAQEEIAKVFAEWKEAGLAGDVERLLSLVTEDCEFWTHGVSAFKGKAAVRAAFSNVMENYTLHQDFEALETMIKNDVAFVRGIETNTVVPKKGGDTIRRQQRAFTMLRRESDGTWRFARGMTNLEP